MILRYFLAYMRILYSDRFALITTAVCVALSLLFIDSMADYIVQDKVIVAFDSEEDSPLKARIGKKLKKDQSVEIIDMAADKRQEAIENGVIDLYIDISDEAVEKMEDGDYEDLVTIYSRGVSLYSVFYPELILGLLIEDAHLGIVNTYLEDLNDSNGDTKIDKMMLRPIYEDVLSQRDIDYFIETIFISKPSSDSNPEADLYKQDSGQILYKKRIVGIVVLILNLYMMILSSRMIEEHDNGTRKRLGISPVHDISIFFGRYLVVFIPTYAFAIMIAIAMSFRGNAFGAFIPILAELTKVTAGLALLMLGISLIFKRSYRYVVASVCIVMFMGLLSGVFFDVELIEMPWPLRKVSLYGPNIDDIVIFLTK